MRMLSVPLFINNDVIMTSLLLLKIIYCSPTSVILSETLLFAYLMPTLREIWMLSVNLTIWRSNDVILRHCVNQVRVRCCV